MGKTVVQMTCHCLKCDFQGTVLDVTQYDQHEQIRWTCPKCGFLWKPIPEKRQREPRPGDRVEVDYYLYAKLVNERDKFKDALESIAATPLQADPGYLMTPQYQARIALNPQLSRLCPGNGEPMSRLIQKYECNACCDGEGMPCRIEIHTTDSKLPDHLRGDTDRLRLPDSSRGCLCDNHNSPEWKRVEAFTPTANEKTTIAQA